MHSARTTPTSCWFTARIATLAILIATVVIPAAAGPQNPVAGPPDPLPGTVVPIPEPRPVLAWTVPLPAAPIVAPLVVADHVVVAYLPGTVAAYRRSDGTEIWRIALAPDQPLIADGGLVFVAADEAIHAVRLADGAVAWRAPAGTVTAPLVAREGWLVISTHAALTARRGADGSTLWSVEAAAQTEPAAIAGDVLFVPLGDGRLVARDLQTGAVRWERRLGGAPGEPLVFGDEIFVGAADKSFYSLDAATGEIDWRVRIGATIRGRASADVSRVYFAALDNLVRAVDRSHGAIRWHQGVPFRPVAGPVAAGGIVWIAGPQRELRKFAAEGGTPLGPVSFPGELSAPPGLFEGTDGLVFAVITGDLQESWKLSLIVPGPA